jgi:hypothetical protein
MSIVSISFHFENLKLDRFIVEIIKCLIIKLHRLSVSAIKMCAIAKTMTVTDEFLTRIPPYDPFVESLPRILSLDPF